MKKSSAHKGEIRFFVGVGASAGGLEALDSFFSHMPSGSGMSFIVIQHLSPDYKSLMVELLSKRTSLKVQRAEEGCQVEPDTVYLIPPKKFITIFHGRLQLSDMDHARGLNLPIDVFFQSLAEDQGERAVGIILSGTGSDGVRGIRSIKEKGGMVIVQSEGTARFDGMPRSALSTGLADVVMSPHEMPDKLLSLSRFKSPVPAVLPDNTLTDDERIARIFGLLRQHSGLDFTDYKPSTVLRRLERRLSITQTRDLQEYITYLEKNREELNTLYRELLIGVTSFFRDREVMDNIREQIIPALFQSEGHQQLRLWVAGCSTGEEAYTLAILLHEYRSQNHLTHSIKIFATDIDKDAVYFAGNGLYPESIAMDIKPAYLARYFVRQEEHYQVCREIREMVVFAHHNIIKDPPFTNIDLISCRNLLIYLQPVLQQKIMEMFLFSLNHQGYLVLGTSETPGDLSSYFRTLHARFKLYQNRGRKLAPRERPLFSLNRVSQLQARDAYPRLYSPPHSSQDEEKLLDRIIQTVTDEQLPLLVAVNEEGEIQYTSGDTALYLSLPPGRIQNNINRMLPQEISIPVSTGLQKVFYHNQAVRYSNVTLREGLMDIEIRPLAGKKGQIRMALILFRHREPPGPVRDSRNTAFDISQEAEQRIRDLEQDLQFNKENLQATIEELETSNEELQATNEELLASNEELQSTNEELQSVNEELYTVNAEYQTKILELTEMTNDLENLTTAFGLPIIFLDENLEIRKFTPETTALFRILASDMGRPLADLTHDLLDTDLTDLLSRVVQSQAALDVEAYTRSGRWYLLHIQPYRIGQGKSSGLVLSLTDISQQKANEQELLKKTQLLNITQTLSHIGGWEWDVLSQSMFWTDEVYRLHGMDPGAIPEGDDTHIRRSLECYHPADRERISQAFERCCTEGTEYDLEADFTSYAGRRMRIRTRAVAIRVDNRIVKVIGNIREME